MMSFTYISFQSFSFFMYLVQVSFGSCSKVLRRQSPQFILHDCNDLSLLNTVVYTVYNMFSSSSLCHGFQSPISVFGSCMVLRPTGLPFVYKSFLVIHTCLRGTQWNIKSLSKDSHIPRQIVGSRVYGRLPVRIVVRKGSYRQSPDDIIEKRRVSHP